MPASFRYPTTAADTARLIEAHRDKVTTKRRRKVSSGGETSYETRFTTPDGSQHRDMILAVIHIAKVEHAEHMKRVRERTGGVCS